MPRQVARLRGFPSRPRQDSAKGSQGGWPKMSGERVDVSVDLQTAHVTVFDFNNSTGSPASKFDQQVMNALQNRVKDEYDASLEFKPGDERFCLGP